MKRFLELSVNGSPILEAEGGEYVEHCKTAAYFLEDMTKSINDKDFAEWLLSRKVTGFNEDDIAYLQGLGMHPVFKYCLAIMGFPQICTNLIRTCIDMNNLNREEILA